MAYRFAEADYEPEPQASSRRGGPPGGKRTGIGVLDPPGPPTRAHGPFARIPASTWMAVVAAALLVIMVASLVFAFVVRP